MSEKNFSYSHDKAWEEAKILQDKIKTGDAKDLSEAHSQIEKERRKNEKSENYSYSEILDAFVAHEPQKIDEQVVKAATELGINISWDDEGRIKDVSYTEIRRLVEKLGVSFLSPTEFWQVFAEAKKNGNQTMIEQMQSDEYTEWLDAVYMKDGNGKVWMMEHPELIEVEGGFEYKGEKKEITIPEGRPGWFNPDDIDVENAVPNKVLLKKEKADRKAWKYWSVFKLNEAVAPIRGYVTSSGTPSYDLDIPVSAKQPVLMFREVRKELPESAMDQEILKTASQHITQYQSTIAEKPATQNPKEHEDFYAQRKNILDFIESKGADFKETKNKNILSIREKLTDILGLIRIMAREKNDQETIETLEKISQKMFSLEKDVVNINSFENFIANSRKNLDLALQEKKRIVFVMGHKNPDTDTAISSVMEAYRNSLIDQETAYIPVIQGKRIPDEIQKLLGEKIAEDIFLSNEPNYEQALNSGQARWILVDQNVSDVQRFAIGTIDHHLLSEKAKKQKNPMTWEMAGSTTALVMQKFEGMGIDIDKALAEILYGATLMDTENRSSSKMTYKDKLVMDNLKKISEISDDEEFYQNLMDKLLNTDDAEMLFERDYKEDWGFGFAVAKAKGIFDQEGNVQKENLLLDLMQLAEKNNKGKNFPVTIVKVVDYLDDNETINRERFNFVFNDFVLPELQEKLFALMEKIITKELGSDTQIFKTDNYIEFFGSGKQLSRKKISPLLEKIVEAFNQHFYSEKLDLNVKREFLELDDKTIAVSKKLNIPLSANKEGLVNYISFPEARAILDELGLVAMSASEYWQVRSDAIKKNDEQMKKHLHAPKFVEFLDTIILDYDEATETGTIIDHPKMIKTADGYQFEGERKKVNIPKAVPGLINPADINPETGFPDKVEDPRQYNNKKLWRYWSPDGKIVSVTRGHIFLLNQPALDTKIHPDDALPSLGIRPCAKKITAPKIEIIDNSKEIVVKIDQV